MKRYSTFVLGTISACALCYSSWGQQATGSAATSTTTVSPNPEAGVHSNNSPGNPSAGTANGSNPAPTAVGALPLSAQAGQTGSMESQRVNALNQEYQRLQQREMTGNQMRPNEQRPTNDVNQLVPAIPGSPPPVAAQRPVNPSSPAAHSRLGAGELNTSALGTAENTHPVSRPTAINGLRQLGYAADDWRIVNQSGRWWFWTPNNSWMYFNNGKWVDYQSRHPDGTILNGRRAVSFPPGYVAEDWRLVFHDGRWWYWTPNDSWMYLRDGTWNDYPANGRVAARGKTANRYSAGYRGANGESQNSVETDTAPNPALNSSGSMSSQTEPSAAATPTKTQDEAGMNIDAQN
jgi:hypothetical protein